MATRTAKRSSLSHACSRARLSCSTGDALSHYGVRTTIVAVALALSACSPEPSDPAYYDCQYDTVQQDAGCTPSCCGSVSVVTKGDPTYCTKTLAQGGHPGQTCAIEGDRLTCTCP